MEIELFKFNVTVLLTYRYCTDSCDENILFFVALIISNKIWLLVRSVAYIKLYLRTLYMVSYCPDMWVTD